MLNSVALHIQPIIVFQMCLAENETRDTVWSIYRKKISGTWLLSSYRYSYTIIKRSHSKTVIHNSFTDSYHSIPTVRYPKREYKKNGKSNLWCQFSTVSSILRCFAWISYRICCVHCWFLHSTLRDNVQVHFLGNSTVEIQFYQKYIKHKIQPRSRTLVKTKEAE